MAAHVDRLRRRRLLSRPRPRPRPRPPSAARPPCPASLCGQCTAGDLTTLIDLDPISGRTFDLGYYRGVAARRGLLSTDGALTHHKGQIRSQWMHFANEQTN
ncbi:Peroxidase 1 [Hordeum vulgare]|nr:Peroxidase 1 [Hordeum vulgare]